MQRALRSRLWFAAAPAAAQAPYPGFADDLLGRWDLTVEAGRRISVVARGAPAHRDGAHGAVRRPLRQRPFRRGPEFPRGPHYVPRARAIRAPSRRPRFEGVVRGDGSKARRAPRRAPPCRSGAAGAAARALGRVRWGKPVALFNGRDLAGWQPRSPERAGCWRVRPAASCGSSLRRSRHGAAFDDFGCMRS